jgi:iron complex outermembrane receptor protein
MFARQDALRVRALLAGECHGTATGALSDPCGVPAVTGRADVELGLGPVRPFAAVGRYVRVPTLGELYGVTDVVRGNGALAPETAVAVDGGLKAAGTVSGAASLRWGAEANVFARYSDDLIQYVRASQGYLAPQNVESARVVGLEATARASAFQRLFGDVVVTLLDPRNTSPSRTTANDLLPLRSPVVVVSSLRFDWPVGRGATETLGPSRGLQRVGAVARVTYLSSRFADPAGLAVLAEQAWLDLEASVALFGTLDVRARVGNVTDALRTDIVGYPLPGRTFFLSLESHL